MYGKKTSKAILLIGAALLLIAYSAALGAERSLDTGLKAWWRFDEGTGIVLHDRSGNGNHGAIKGAKWVRNGKGFALEFDGLDDIVDCGVGSSLDLRDHVSMMVWVWLERQTSPGEPGIVGKAYKSYVLTQSHDYGVFTYINGGPNHADAETDLKEWTHLATTYDGRLLKLYVNGKLVGEQSLPGPVNSGGRFWMGRSDGEIKWTKDAHLRGKITDVRVYDHVLTSAQIASATRTTNRNDTVTVSFYPIPLQERMIIKLDRRGLKEHREQNSVTVTLGKQPSAGKPTGPPVISTVVRRFDANNKAEVSLDMKDVESGVYLVQATVYDAAKRQVGLTATTECIWTRAELPRRLKKAGRTDSSVTKSEDVTGPEKVIKIGSAKQLFLDDFLIEHKQGIRLKMNPPYQHTEPVIKADQPWETSPGAHLGGYHSALKEDGKIRVWYEFNWRKADQSPGRSMAYAESTDGIRFVKPTVGLISLNGDRKNNLLMDYSRGAAVWLDPQASPAQRYRNQYKSSPTDMAFYASGDGIHWNPTHTCQIGKVDTRTSVLFDLANKRYLMYTRKWGGNKSGTGHRMTRRLESDDLVTWRNESIVLEADYRDLATYRSHTGQPPVDYYAALVFRYPDVHGPWIMITQTYWHWQQSPDKRKHGMYSVSWDCLKPGAIDARMAVSRDGEHFEFVGDRAPFLRLGPDGSFYSRMVWAATPGPIRMGDELWFYFGGGNANHFGYTDPAAKGKQRGGVGRAVMRLDGFVSADAGFDGGQVITKPVVFAGKRLVLNLDTSAGGSVLVELQDKDGRPIDGYAAGQALPVIGNSVSLPVTWGDVNHPSGDVNRLAGKPIRVRFIMRDCKLYAFQFSE